MKKTFKKSLSLMLAMLMLMSTWVFTPIEASAVNATDATYKGKTTAGMVEYMSADKNRTLDQGIRFLSFEHKANTYEAATTYSPTNLTPQEQEWVLDAAKRGKYVSKVVINCWTDLDDIRHEGDAELALYYYADGNDERYVVADYMTKAQLKDTTSATYGNELLSSLVDIEDGDTATKNQAILWVEADYPIYGASVKFVKHNQIGLKRYLLINTNCFLAKATSSQFEHISGTDPSRCTDGGLKYTASNGALWDPDYVTVDFSDMKGKNQLKNQYASGWDSLNAKATVLTADWPTDPMSAPFKDDDEGSFYSFNAGVLDQFGIIMPDVELDYEFEGVEGLWFEQVEVDGVCKGRIHVPDEALENFKNGERTVDFKLTLSGVSTPVSKTFQLYSPEYKIKYWTHPQDLGNTYYDEWGSGNPEDFKIAENNYIVIHNHNQLLQKKPNLISDGYVLKGFSTDLQDASYAYDNQVPNFTNVVGSDYQVGQDTKVEKTNLHALWQAKDVTLTFVDRFQQETGVRTGKYSKNLDFNGITAKTCNPEPYEYKDNVYTFNGYWLNQTTGEIETNIDSRILTEDTTYEAQYSPAKASYDYNFIANGVSSVSGTANYEQEIAVPTGTPTKASSAKYDYNFLGWTKQLSDEADVTVDADAEETVSFAKEKVTIYSDSTYVPVYSRTIREYDITFNYDVYDADTDTVSTKTETQKFAYGDALGNDFFPEVEDYRYMYDQNTFLGWSLDDNSKDAIDTFGTCAGEQTYYAVFEDTNAKYKVEFVDHEGNVIAILGEYDYGDRIFYPTGDQYELYNEKVVSQYFKDSKRYDFTKEWNLPTEDGAEIERDWIITPIYTETDVYEINFYDMGKNCIETRYLAADETLEIPEALEVSTDKTNTYNFLGWFNGEEKLEGNITNLSSDMDIYAKYEIVPFEYKVIFDYNDGLGGKSEETYSYNEVIEVPENPTKPADDAFTYTFKSWDKVVSNTCKGDVTYKAVYSFVYNYYDVKWLAAKPEGGTFTDDDVHYQTKAVYNSTITPSLTAPESGLPDKEGQTVILEGWYNVETNEKFNAGDKVTGNLAFYPVFTYANDPKTITFVDDNGEAIAKVELEYNSAIDCEDLFGTPAKASTEDYHYNFSKWTLADGSALPNNLVNDIKVVANFEEVDHVYDQLVGIEKYPTFKETGIATYTCDCGYDHEVEVDVPVLKDTTAPNGSIQAGGVMSTETSESNPVVLGVDSTISLNYRDKAEKDDNFNPDSKGSGIARIGFMVTRNNGTAVDQGHNLDEVVESFNFVPVLKDVDNDVQDGDVYKLVCSAIDANGNGSDEQTLWVEYDCVAPTIDVASTSTPNETSDKNTAYCEDVTLTISKEADEDVTVTVNGKVVAVENDTITFTKAGMYQVIATDAAGNSTQANFTIRKHELVEVVNHGDGCGKVGESYSYCKNCNYVSEKVEVEATAHDYETITVKATCTEDGYTQEVCKNCDDKKDKVVLPALDHDMKLVKSYPATCTEDGVEYYKCTRCGETKEVKVPLETGKEGHVEYLSKITNATCTSGTIYTYSCKYCGKVIRTETKDDMLPHEYEYTVTRAATCTTEGEKFGECKHCDATITEPIAINPSAHDWNDPKDYIVDGVVVGTICTCKNNEEHTKINYKDVTEVKEYTVVFTGTGTDRDDTHTFNVTNVSPTVNVGSVNVVEEYFEDGTTYKFKGWKDEATGLMYYNNFNAKADMTLVPVYSESTEKYVVTFENGDGSTLKVYTGFKYNDEFNEDISALNPTKKSTVENDFTFEGWSTIPSKITSNVTVKPIFTSVARTYTVSFKIDGVVVQTSTVGAHEDVVYEGELPEIYEDNGSTHKQVKGWSKSTTDVTSDISTNLEYEYVEHTFVTKSVAPTCTTGSGTLTSCTYCGHSTFVADGKEPALGHSWTQVSTDGEFNYYKCTKDGCNATKKEVIETDDTQVVNVQIKYDDGSPASGVTVKLYSNATLVATSTTNASGVATFNVKKGTYNVEVTGANIEGKLTGSIVVDGSGNVDMEKFPVINKHECGCSCHENGFWGSIFRFFHRIIATFVGEFKCCSCPDARYYK